MEALTALLAQLNTNYPGGKPRLQENFDLLKAADAEAAKFGHIVGLGVDDLWYSLDGATFPKGKEPI